MKDQQKAWKRSRSVINRFITGAGIHKKCSSRIESLAKHHATIILVTTVLLITSLTCACDMSAANNVTTAVVNKITEDDPEVISTGYTNLQEFAELNEKVWDEWTGEVNKEGYVSLSAEGNTLQWTLYYDDIEEDLYALYEQRSENDSLTDIRQNQYKELLEEAAALTEIDGLEILVRYMNGEDVIYTETYTLVEETENISEEEEE